MSRRAARSWPSSGVDLITRHQPRRGGAEGGRRRQRTARGLRDDAHGHPDRREHPGPGPGHHRQDRRLPHRGDDRLRHQHRRRRHAGQGRHAASTTGRCSTRSRTPSPPPAPTASIVFVPPPYAADSIMEAADAGIRVCVAITDGIPAQDMIRVKRYMRRYKAENRMRLMGPNCAGVISPGQLPARHHARPHLPARAASASSAARARWATRPPRR